MELDTVAVDREKAPDPLSQEQHLFVEEPYVIRAQDIPRVLEFLDDRLNRAPPQIPLVVGTVEALHEGDRAEGAVVRAPARCHDRVPVPLTAERRREPVEGMNAFVVDQVAG